MKYALIVLLFLTGCSLFKNSIDNQQIKLIKQNADNIDSAISIISRQSKVNDFLFDHIKRIDKEIRLLKEEKR